MVVPTDAKTSCFNTIVESLQKLLSFCQIAMSMLPLLPPLPPLPQLEGSLLLDVFTHNSLHYDGKTSNEDFGDNNRLADLGTQVLNLVVTQRLFFKKPMLTATEIVVSDAAHV